MCVDSARSLPSPKISVLRRNQHFVMKSFLIFWFIRPQWLPLWSVALSDGSFQGSWNPGVWSSVQGLWCVPQSTPNSFNSEVLFIPFLVHICYICSIFINYIIYIYRYRYIIIYIYIIYIYINILLYIYIYICRTVIPKKVVAKPKPKPPPTKAKAKAKGQAKHETEESEGASAPTGSRKSRRVK